MTRLLALAVIGGSFALAAPTQAQQMCGGLQGLSCAEGQYCDYGTGQCGIADGAGVCKPRPEVCTEQFDPVCGDGHTYANACHAAMAGVTIDHYGECGKQSERRKNEKKPKKRRKPTWDPHD